MLRCGPPVDVAVWLSDGMANLNVCAPAKRPFGEMVTVTIWPVSVDGMAK